MIIMMNISYEDDYNEHIAISFDDDYDKYIAIS